MAEKGKVTSGIVKYLRKNIDGAYKIAFHPMECEVFMYMYYQVPENADTLDEMKFIISITSYANKIRINLTEDTKYEKTIGQLILQPEEVTDLNTVRKRVLTMVKKSINKEFAEFDFVF